MGPLTRLHNIGGIQGLHSLGFIKKSLEAGGVLLGVLDDLHSHLCPGQEVLGQLRGGEAALTHGPEELAHSTRLLLHRNGRDAPSPGTG